MGYGGFLNESSSPRWNLWVRRLADARDTDPTHIGNLERKRSFGSPALERHVSFASLPAAESSASLLAAADTVGVDERTTGPQSLSAAPVSRRSHSTVVADSEGGV